LTCIKVTKSLFATLGGIQFSKEYREMETPKDLKRHAALLDEMAKTVGVDLQQAAIRGDLRIDDISDAVLSCANCADPLHCTQWLQDHADGAQATPDYCNNAALLMQLRDDSDGGNNGGNEGDNQKD
jgi:hypothetical protein